MVVAFSFESDGSTVASSRNPLAAPDRTMLQLIADGQSYDEVASLLRLERDAVDKEMSALRRRIGAATDEHAVAIALRAHWID